MEVLLKCTEKHNYMTTGQTPSADGDHLLCSKAPEHFLNGPFCEIAFSPNSLMLSYQHHQENVEYLPSSEEVL